MKDTPVLLHWLWCWPRSRTWSRCMITSMTQLQWPIDQMSHNVLTHKGLCFRFQKKTRIVPERSVCVLVLSEKHTQWGILECLWFFQTFGQWPKIVPKTFFCSWVFVNDIVDATVIRVECDSWRLGHGLENWQIFGFRVLIVKLFFCGAALAFFSIEAWWGVRGWNVNKRRINIAE